MVRVNPVWGAMADLRMFWLALSGGLQAEIARCDRGTGQRHEGLWTGEKVAEGGSAQPTFTVVQSRQDARPGTRHR